MASGDVSTTVKTSSLPLSKILGFLTARLVDVSDLLVSNRLCLLSIKNTFSGSLSVLRGTMDHMQESVI